MKSEMPNLNVLVLLLVLGLILNSIAIYVDVVPNFIFSPSEIGQYSIRTKIAITVTLFLKSILNIIISIWLYQKAKTQKEHKFVWMIFGLFFGIIAIILFYLIILTKEIKKLNRNFSNEDMNRL